MHDISSDSRTPAATCMLAMREKHRGLTLLTLCVGVLVAQVDTSVVNLAVRPIGEYSTPA